MRKRRGFALYAFLAVLAVSLLTTSTINVLSRRTLAGEVQKAISHTASRGGYIDDISFLAAEHRILEQNDRSMWAITALAVVISGLAAYAMAHWLARPLGDLEASVNALAHGDHDRRALVAGPTEIARIARSFNRMADSVAESERLRQRLVADVAHELRNPLGAALAQAEAMLDGVLPLDEARVESLTDDLRHVTSIVDDLRELAAAEAGNLHYSMAPFNLSDLIQQQIKRMRPRLTGGVKIHAEGLTGPIVIEGDPLRIAQVLRNLLLNSRRHTTSGSIVIEVAESPDEVTVGVRDTGEGISEEALPHIFERLYRADGSRSSETGGAGLGLAISDSIIRRHGGEMFAKSESGCGATVGFTLPRHQVPRPGAEAD